jgi:hypothetical protein
MEQNQTKCAEMINEEITTQVLDALRENTMYVQTQARELTYKFHTLVRAIEKTHKA